MGDDKKDNGDSVKKDVGKKEFERKVEKIEREDQWPPPPRDSGKKP